MKITYRKMKLSESERNSQLQQHVGDTNFLHKTDIIKPLTYFINESIIEGFPDSLKCGMVLPIFKRQNIASEKSTQTAIMKLYGKLLKSIEKTLVFIVWIPSEKL